MLCDIDWQLFTGVSGQHVAPILKAQRVQEERVITNLKDFNFLTIPLATAAVVPTASKQQNNTLPAPHQSNEQYGGIVVSQVSIPRLLTHSVNPSFSWKLSPLPTPISFTEVLKVFVGKSTIRFSLQAVQLVPFNDVSY
jgi:hypothetical protein